LRPCRVRLSNSPSQRSARRACPLRARQASSPLFFVAARGGRSSSSPLQHEGMERREALPNRPRLGRRERPRRRTRAPRRSTQTSLRSLGFFAGDFCPRDRASGRRRRALHPPDPGGFRRPSSPRTYSHRRQPVLVPADGDPRPPECGVTNPARGRRIPPCPS
jgi:hypothetical protein